MGYIGDLTIIYPKPYSIYFRGTIGFTVCVAVLEKARMFGYGFGVTGSRELPAAVLRSCGLLPGARIMFAQS